MRIIILCLYLSSLSLAMKGQPTLIRGQVIGADDARPLAGAHITGTGASYNGALANENGHFIFHLLPDMDSVRASYLGYRTLTLPADAFSADTMTVLSLKREPYLLHTVEVQPKKELNLSLDVYEELLITGLKNDSIQPFHRQEQWDRKQLMLSLPSEYDEAFWGASNYILPSHALLDVIANMEAGAEAGPPTADTLSGGWVLAHAAQAKAFQSGPSLYLKPYMESEWMDERTGPMLKKEHTGDFQFEALVEVQRASDTTLAPDKGFQQGGILVRNPESEQENYLMIGLGAGGNPKLKVGGIYTRDGKSSVKIDKPGLSRLRLRIRRQGPRFSLSYQIPGTEQWTLLRKEGLPGFPETVELGLAGYTHFPGNAPTMRPDLLVKFSEIDIR